MDKDFLGKWTLSIAGGYVGPNPSKDNGLVLGSSPGKSNHFLIVRRDDDDITLVANTNGRSVVATWGQWSFGQGRLNATGARPEDGCVFEVLEPKPGPKRLLARNGSMRYYFCYTGPGTAVTCGPVNNESTETAIAACCTVRAAVVTPGMEVLLVQKELPNVDLDWVDLSEADLSTKNLEKASFVNADLWATRLNGANLAGAAFTNARLSGADLRGADLTGATFKGADLNEAQLQDATLDGASFVGANLGAADLSGASLVGTDFSGVDVTRTRLGAPPKFSRNEEHRTKFANATLRLEQIGLDWSYLDLTNANILDLRETESLPRLQASHSLLQGIPLFQKDLHGAHFDNAVLSQCSLDHSNLEGASFAAAQLEGASLGGAILKGASLVGAWLTGSDLASAYMPNVNLSDAKLGNAVLAYAHLYGSESTVVNAILAGADLSSANLGSMNLQQARLEGATLDGANLIDCDLRGAELHPDSQGRPVSLVKASLQGANLEGADLTDAHLGNAAIGLEDGVILASLSASEYQGALDKGRISDELRNDFRDKGYVLSKKAEVKVLSRGQSWAIKDHPPRSVREDMGYVEFKLVVASNDRLVVYGTTIAVSRLGDRGELEVAIVTVRPTVISPANFSEDTVCPNLKTYETNQSHGVPWEDMMTASELPRPPKCIPSPDHWCPRTSPLELLVGDEDSV